MNNYHILTAIHALEAMKADCHLRADARKEATSFHSIEYRELCLHRETEATEALEAFKQLLTDPTAPKKQDHLGKNAVMMMKDEIHVTASMDDLSEKPKITRPHRQGH